MLLLPRSGTLTAEDWRKLEKSLEEMSPLFKSMIEQRLDWDDALQKPRQAAVEILHLYGRLYTAVCAGAPGEVRGLLSLGATTARGTRLPPPHTLL